MYDAGLCLSYSMGVFLIAMVSGCVLNIFKQHYVFQLAGITFLFTYSIFITFDAMERNPGITPRELYLASMPLLAGISACLISMLLGFWIFLPLRRKFRG